MRPRIMVNYELRKPKMLKPPVRMLPVILAFAAHICLATYVAAAETDPVDEVLKERATADPERIQYVKQLIANNSGHPRILELRLFRTGQLTGVSQEPQHLRSVIEELKQLARDADAADQTLLAFRAQMRIGRIYFHAVKDMTSAYRQYKSLETHPSLAGNDLETDYRRTLLYVSIAQSAIGFPVRKFNEVEKYTRLVMAYPYLGMADRNMYRKFYELYGEAGRLYIVAFWRNPEKLYSIEIYPSHPYLIRQRREALRQALRIPEPEEVLREVAEDIMTQAIEKEPGGIEPEPLSGQTRQLPAPEVSTDQAPVPGSPSQAPAASAALRSLWPFLLIGIGGLLLGAFILWRRYRAKTP